MGVVTQPGASEVAVDRTRLGLEVAIVLGLSLGQSAVYSVLRIIERLTREVPLAQQTSTLNPSVTPDRPWLDLTYQLVGIAFGLMPVLLALYLLNLTDPPAGRTIGFDLTRPRFDLGFGVLIAVVIGVPGLGLYALARALGINTEVQASGLTDNWWTVPVLILSAAQNALLEEVVVIGYSVHSTAPTCLERRCDHCPQRDHSRLVPPLPGHRWLHRQSDHGCDLRPDLSALEARRSARRCAHPARYRGLRGIRPGRSPRQLALSYGGEPLPQFLVIKLRAKNLRFEGRSARRRTR